MVAGYLKAQGVLVQRAAVRAALVEVDPIGTATRWGQAIRRRTYSVPCPNALWHMDAHMKLIRYVALYTVADSGSTGPVAGRSNHWICRHTHGTYTDRLYE